MVEAHMMMKRRFRSKKGIQRKAVEEWGTLISLRQSLAEMPKDGSEQEKAQQLLDRAAGVAGGLAAVLDVSRRDPALDRPEFSQYRAAFDGLCNEIVDLATAAGAEMPWLPPF